MNEASIIVEEKDGKEVKPENTKQFKTDIIFAVAYSISAVLSFIFIFARFAVTQTEDALAKFVYSINTLTVSGSGIAAVNAVLANVLFIGSAVILFLAAVVKACKLFIKKNKLVNITGLVLSALLCLVFAVAYAPTAAALTQYLYSLDGSITVFLPIVYLLPVAVFASALFDIELYRRNCTLKKWKYSHQMVIYPVILLLSIVTFALPVIFVSNACDVLAPQNFRTLYGVNGARAALMIMLCAVLAFAAFSAHMTWVFARQIKSKKLKNIAAWTKIAVCSAFAAMFVFCMPAIINHFINYCQISAESIEASLLEGSEIVPRYVGAGAYAMMIVPVLTLAAVIWDGSQTWNKIKVKMQPNVRGRYGMLIMLFSALYTTISCALWLCLSVPYGSLNIEGRTTAFYVLNYAGATGFEYVESLVPTTLALFILATVLLTISLTALVVNIFWDKKFLRKKGTAQTICLIIKPVIAIAVTALFIAFYVAVDRYKSFLNTHLTALEIESFITFVPTLLQVSAIGLLSVCALDMLNTFRTYYSIWGKKQNKL